MLATPSYLFSDVHLGAAPADVEPSLVRFLKWLPGRARSVVINGDLFDFWFEWKSVMPRVGYRVLAALADLKAADVDVLWIAGNHDCWGADLLQQDVGIRYVTSNWRGTIGAWSTLVAHGDGLRQVEDRRYRALRRVLRNGLAIRAFRQLHPDWASRLALGSSHASRVHRARDGGVGLRDVAMTALAADRTLDLIVYGHSHVPALLRSPEGGVYANPGSWLDQPGYLRIDEERIELRRWNGSAEGDCLDALDRRPEKALA